MDVGKDDAIRNSAVAVGTSPVTLSQELYEAMVVARTFINTSGAGQAITLSWGTDAVAGIGIVLYPGSAWTESVDNNYMPSTRRVSAVSSAASGQISVFERIRRV